MNRGRLNADSSADGIQLREIDSTWPGKWLENGSRPGWRGNGFGYRQEVKAACIQLEEQGSLGRVDAEPWRERGSSRYG
jgi:hypothetical protein